jgi:hypothetical protein
MRRAVARQPVPVGTIFRHFEHAVQEADMGGIDFAFGRLQPIALVKPARGVNLGRRQRHPLHARQFRHQLLRAHIDPGDAAGLAGRIARDPGLVLQGRKVIRRDDVGNVDALAVDVEFPPVIHAADSTLLVSAEEQWCKLVRTIGRDDSDLAVGIAESQQVFAQDADANRRAIGLGQLA